MGSSHGFMPLLAELGGLGDGFAIDMSHLTVLLVRCCTTRLFSRRKD